MNEFITTLLFAMVLAMPPTPGTLLKLADLKPAGTIPTTPTNLDENLKIEAKLGKRSFIIGERVQLVLWITNRQTELLAVADPRRGGDSLRLRLRLPNGEERSFTSGEALSAPGVRQIPGDMRLPPGVRQNFEFDLAKLTDLTKPGRYVLKLEYTWRSGEEVWRSDEMPFSIVASRRKPRSVSARTFQRG